MLEGRWQDRHVKFVSDEGEGLYDPDEELEVLETLIGDTGKVGEAAVRCLERMSSEDMYGVTTGMVVLLIEFREMQKNE